MCIYQVLYTAVASDAIAGKSCAAACAIPCRVTPAEHSVAGGQRLITDHVPLQGAVDRGFEPLVADPESHLKVLIDCRQ
jgi:hypothetical protein